MKIYKKIFKILIIIPVIIFCTACWNYRELNQVFIVLSATVDKNINNGNYIVTVEILNPTEHQDYEEKISNANNFSAEGLTIFDAIRNIISISGRKLYWGHCNIWVISGQVAKEGIQKVLDIINRESQFREDIYIFISENDTENIFLDEKNDIHDEVAEHYKDIMNNYKNSGLYVYSPLWKITKELTSKLMSTTLPIMQKSKSYLQSHGLINGSAVFSGDKMIGKLEPIETRSMLFIKEELDTGPSISIETNDGNRVSVEVREYTQKINSIIKNNQIKFMLDGKFYVDIVELQTEKNLISETNRNELEKQIEEMLINQFDNVIKKAQKEFKVDIFGFANILQRQHPSYFKTIDNEWAEFFKDSYIDVNLDVIIEGSELRIKPLVIGE